MRIEQGSSQAGLFDPQERERALAEIRRLLDRSNKVKDWEIFGLFWRSSWNTETRSVLAGPAKDPLLMLKMCVLQDLHGLSDEETEYQVLDRTSFRRVLGLSVSDKGPNHLGDG